MATVTIIPTVLAQDKKEFEQRLNDLLKISKNIQIDVMDGKFVKTKSIPLADIPDLHQYQDHIIEAHLMVQHPEIEAIAYIAKGCRRIIFHIEAVPKGKVIALINTIQQRKCDAVIALNPETPVHAVIPYVRYADGVLFLGVHPGHNGAPYVTNTPQRVKSLVLANTNRKLLVQVDGGMTPETIGAVVSAGADRVNSGSFVNNSPEKRKALMQLRKAALAGLQSRKYARNKGAKLATKKNASTRKIIQKKKTTKKNK